jgi:hypothetical protein
MVDRTGFEPVTSSMSLKRSNRAELTVHDIDYYTILIFKWNFTFGYGKPLPTTRCCTKEGLTLTPQVLVSQVNSYSVWRHYIRLEATLASFVSKMTC